jgi:hypothetical protein
MILAPWRCGVASVSGGTRTLQLLADYRRIVPI